MKKSERVEAWIEYAEKDYRMAFNEYNTQHPIHINGVCYLSQQAIEKALKAILVQNEEQMPKIHQLDKLLKLTMKYEPNIKIEEKIASKLTDFAVESRYPDNLYEFTDEDAKLGLKYAREILDKVKVALNITQELTTVGKGQEVRSDKVKQSKKKRDHNER